MPKKRKKAVHKASKKSLRKGTKLECKECGLVVSVVDACECGDPWALTCCGEPMECVA
jgi:hypothetical protein